MPAGSVIKIPDSLWNSAFWGSTLVGCALRGGRVLIIAPAADNAPAPGFGTLGRSQELLSRLLMARALLAQRFDDAGGLLRVGIYASEIEVTDIGAKVRAIATTFDQQSWLRELFGFADAGYTSVTELAGILSPVSMVAVTQREFEYDPRPKLHMKANYFASGEAWSIMTRPEWQDLSWEYAQQRVAQVQSRVEAVASFDEMPDAFVDVGAGMVLDWFARLDPAARERVVFYTIMGSHNQNYRSMVIDGEVAFIISQWPSIIPYLDLISLIGQSRWIEDAAELERLVPADPGWRRRVARWVKVVL
jgi:hypothetical protein